MYRRSHGKRPDLTARVIRTLAILSLLLAEPVLEAKVADVGGVIFTLTGDHVQTLWPNARVTLKNLDTNDQFATVSNELGAYSFAGMLAGQYEVTVALAGF